MATYTSSWWLLWSCLSCVMLCFAGNPGSSNRSCNEYASCLECVQSTCGWCISRDQIGACEESLSYTNGCKDTWIPASQAPTEPACPSVLPVSGLDMNVHDKDQYRAKALLTNVPLTYFGKTWRCRFTRPDGVNAGIVNGVVSRSPDMIQCDTLEFDLTNDVPLQEFTFDVVVGQADYKLDNPSNVHVTVYKCSGMANNCGQCLSNLKEEFSCGWCTRTNKCDIARFCQNPPQAQVSPVRPWLSPEDGICPDPRILGFSPTSGPKFGGTNVTISGLNLGNRIGDVTVIIAEYPCALIPELYDPPSSMSCTTSSVSELTKEGKVVVKVGNYETTSNYHYTYETPVFQGIHPYRGAWSGGTQLVLFGYALNAGNVLTIMIGPDECQLKSRNQTHAVCTTFGKTGRYTSDERNEVRVIMDGTELEAKEDFIYVEDPTITSFEDLKIPLSGGISFSVFGKNLYVVQKADFFVTVQGKHYITPCKIASDTKAKCTTANLENRLFPKFSQPVSMDDNKVGFLLDHLRITLQDIKRREPLKARVSYYPNPVVDIFLDEQQNRLYVDGEPLVITGAYLDVFQLNVTVGESACPVTDASNNTLKCTPPVKPNVHKDGEAKVEVFLGNFQKEPGWLLYSSFAPKETSLALAIPLGVGLPIVLVTIVLIICIMKRHKQRNFGKPVYDNDEEYEVVNDAEGIEVEIDDQESTHLTAGEPDDTTHTYLELEPMGEQKSDENPADEVTDSYLIPPMNSSKLVDTNYVNEEEDNSYVNMLLSRLDDKELKLSVEQLLIPRSRLEIGDELGKGHFGKVHLGILKCKSSETHRKVAIKTLHENFNDTDKIEMFLREGVIMHRFDHPHVLTLYGVSLDAKENPMVILPYMANGDLKRFINCTDKDLTVLQLLDFAGQIAEGMNYISEQKYVHRDLAARNCMVDEKFVVKVADFGMTRNIYEKDYYRTHAAQAIPAKWMAPESLENGIYTVKSDVWSFGVLLWELMTRGRTPYPEVRVNVILEMKEYLRSGRRMGKPKDCPESIYVMMELCWKLSADERPTFSQLLNTITAMLQIDEDTPESETAPLYQNIYRTESIESLDMS